MAVWSRAWSPFLQCFPVSWKLQLWCWSPDPVFPSSSPAFCCSSYALFLTQSPPSSDTSSLFQAPHTLYCSSLTRFHSLLLLCSADKDSTWNKKMLQSSSCWQIISTIVTDILRSSTGKRFQVTLPTDIILPRADGIDKSTRWDVGSKQIQT